MEPVPGRQGADTNVPHLQILGTRGVGKGHGGFESFAEDLALYLRNRGWRVTVYCQELGPGEAYEAEWRGVRTVHIPVSGAGSGSTVRFDWHATRHAVREPGLPLVLGYNTAVFSALFRAARVPSLMNMDGLEWQRRKYGLVAKTWFYVNEWLGSWISNALIADHPEIARHLDGRGVRKKVTTIAYGSRRVEAIDRSILAVLCLGLEDEDFALVVARPEPENSILEVVRAYSAKERPTKLVVLGNYHQSNPYQAAVLNAAGSGVCFPGAIYDRDLVDALRFHSTLYVHGHTVGGTNPALVEAMGASAAVLAHDNRFNRWVAGPGAAYFSDEAECQRQLDRLLGDAGDTERLAMRRASFLRHREAFGLDDRLADYERLCTEWMPQYPR